MSSTYQTGQAVSQISGSVAIGSPQPTALQIFKAYNSGKNAETITAGTGKLLYTVTGGKTFYLTGLTFYGAGSANSFELRDGTTIAGTIKQCGGFASGVLSARSLVNPVPYTNGVFIDVSATNTMIIGVEGFEV